MSSQPPTIPSPPSKSRRELAKIGDFALILLIATAFKPFSEVLSAVIFLLGWPLYNWLAVAIWGTTLSKHLARTIVVDQHYQRLTWTRSLTRSLLDTIYFVIAIAFAMTGPAPGSILLAAVSYGILCIANSPTYVKLFGRVVLRPNTPAPLRKMPASPPMPPPPLESIGKPIPFPPETTPQIRTPPNPTEKPQFDDQLRSLAKLRDDGIITEEDFQNKKRSILNL